MAQEWRHHSGRNLRNLQHQQHDGERCWHLRCHCHQRLRQRLFRDPATLNIHSLNINPTSQNFSASGSNGIVNVNSTGSCGWTATSNASWIKITSGASGTGNGTVGFNVAANSGAQRSGTITIAGKTFTITQDGAPGGGTIQFLSTTTFVGEAGVGAVVTVTRSGDTSATSAVDYRTTDTDTFTVGCADAVNNLGGAFGRCDFAFSLDTIIFAAGETTKTIIVPIIDDSWTESNETLGIVLSNPVGATLGSPSTSIVSITDNDSVNGPNPIFTTPFFVRLHYLDFLSREPDPSGFSAWSAVLNTCSDVNNNPACDRLLVSSSFFGSQEFQLKGYFVYRFYKLAFNRLPTYGEMVVDMRSVTGQTANEVFQKRRRSRTHLHCGLNSSICTAHSPTLSTWLL